MDAFQPPPFFIVGVDLIAAVAPTVLCFALGARDLEAAAGVFVATFVMLQLQPGLRGVVALLEAAVNRANGRSSNANADANANSNVNGDAHVELELDNDDASGGDKDKLEPVEVGVDVASAETTYTRFASPPRPLNFVRLVVNLLWILPTTFAVYIHATNTIDNATGYDGLLLTVAVTTLLAAAYIAVPHLSMWAVNFFLQPRKFDNTNALRRHRDGTYPPAYPNGWYRILNSSDLPAKACKPKHVSAIGQEMALFRGESGQVFAVQAHCPHLGASFAIGGTVHQDNIVCPFHKWEFEGASGKCAHIPYCASHSGLPKAANLQRWCVAEHFGQIFVWLHAEGLPPTYALPTSIGIAGGNQVYRGQYNAHVQMHIIEFLENTTDFQHFDPLHGQMLIPFTELPIPGVTVNHIPGWEEGKKKHGRGAGMDHVAYFYDNASVSLFGKEMPKSSAQATIQLVGPGSFVCFTFDTPIGSITLFQTHTPTDHLELDVQFRWFADESMPRLLVWYIVGNWVAQWKRDIFVWENKVYRRKPVLARGDGPMGRLRSWYKQFYTAGSAKLSQPPPPMDW